MNRAMERIERRIQKVKDSLSALSCCDEQVADNASRILLRVSRLTYLLIGLQNQQIQKLGILNSSLQTEIERLKQPRVVTRQTAVTHTSGKDNYSVKLKLLTLHKQNKLPPFQTKRGRGATDSDLWIRKTLADLSFSNEDIEIAIADPAVWYNVDKVLYRSRSMRNVRANNLARSIGRVA